MDVDVRGVAVGFLTAVVVLGALVWAVGLEGVVQAVAMVDPVDVVAVFGAAFAWLVIWSLTLRTVLDALDVHIGYLEALLVFASSTFANNITPFGQAGGEPFSALLISRATDSGYERGLAAIASVDTLNFFPSIALSVVGLGYYIAVFTVGDDRLFAVAGAVVALAVAVPVTGFLLWRRRTAVEDSVVRFGTPLARRVTLALPWFDPPERADVAKRVSSFFRALERIADSRTTLLEAIAFSTAGWTAMSVALWLSLLAVSTASVPFAAALVAVPVGSIASITPLPGGLGGVELALVLIVVPLTAVGVEAATSAALVYRAATYWFPTALGGIATVILEGRTGR